MATKKKKPRLGLSKKNLTPRYPSTEFRRYRSSQFPTSPGGNINSLEL